MNSTLLQHAGDAQSAPAGDLSVNVIYQGFGAGTHLYRVTVTRPGFCPQPHNDRADDRSMGHPDHQEAQALAEHHARGVVELLTVEQNGIADEQIAAVADGINADLDAAHTARVEAYKAEQADVAAIMADAKPYRRVRNTRTHVFVKPLNDRQAQAIRQHRDGVVHLGNGVTRPMLAAIADKGYGQLVMQPGTRYRIDSLRLNAAGLAIAGIEVAA